MSLSHDRIAKIAVNKGLITEDWARITSTAGLINLIQKGKHMHHDTPCPKMPPGSHCGECPQCMANDAEAARLVDDLAPCLKTTESVNCDTCDGCTPDEPAEVDEFGCPIEEMQITDARNDDGDPICPQCKSETVYMQCECGHMWCLPAKKPCVCKGTGYVDPGAPADIPWDGTEVGTAALAAAMVEQCKDYPLIRDGAIVVMDTGEAADTKTTCAKCEDHFIEEQASMRAIIKNLTARNADVEEALKKAGIRLDKLGETTPLPVLGDLVSGDPCISAEFCTDDAILTENTVVAEIPIPTPPGEEERPSLHLRWRQETQQRRLDNIEEKLERLLVRVSDDANHLVDITGLLRTSIEQLSARVDRVDEVLKGVSKEWHDRAAGMSRDTRLHGEQITELRTNIKILRKQLIRIEEKVDPGCGRESMTASEWAATRRNPVDRGIV